jgi:pSer/pThr/pTyr-binding forkhead associated (FHA) protein
MELEAIVLKAMQPKQDQRYESARAFYEALEEYVARQPLTSGTTVRQTAGPTDDTAITNVGQQPQQWALVNLKNETSEKHAIQGDNTVGRDRTCSIVLSHPAVSRRHARITLSGSSCVLEDLKSANGTYVNNTRVERVKLKAGDIVRFGADPACSYVLRDH